MTRLIKNFLIIFILFFSPFVSADNFTSLQKWSTENDPNDKSVIFYQTQRCNSLFIAQNKMLETKSPELANNMLLLAADFYIFGINFLSNIENLSFEVSKAKYTEILIQTSNLYVEDMKTSWLKNGSYFDGSYLKEDILFCNLVHKMYKSQNLF